MKKFKVMKTSLIIFVALFHIDAQAMGNRPVFPGNPLSPMGKQHLNDIEETTGKVNQLSDPQGYEDQQMMEEEVEEKKEKGLEESKKKELKNEKLRPIEAPKVRHD